MQGWQPASTNLDRSRTNRDGLSGWKQQPSLQVEVSVTCQGVAGHCSPALGPLVFGITLGTAFGICATTAVGMRLVRLCNELKRCWSEGKHLRGSYQMVDILLQEVCHSAGKAIFFSDFSLSKLTN